MPPVWIQGRYSFCGSVKTCVLGGSHPGSLASCSRSAYSGSSATVPAQGSVRKVVKFQLPPPVPVRRNPNRTVRVRKTCSAISPPFLLMGVLWRVDAANLFQSFWNTTGSRRAIQLLQDDFIYFCIRHISLFLSLFVNKPYSIY